jgi:hypothetical protein
MALGPSCRQDHAVLSAVKDATRRDAVALWAIPDRASARRDFNRQVGAGKWSRRSHQEMAVGDTAPPTDKARTSGHIVCYINRTS